MTDQTATPAPEQRTVTDCMGCLGWYEPWLHGEPDVPHCQIDEKERPLPSSFSIWLDAKETTPPDWCPLRAGPVLLVLREGT